MGMNLERGWGAGKTLRPRLQDLGWGGESWGVAWPDGEAAGRETEAGKGGLANSLGSRLFASVGQRCGPHSLRAGAWGGEVTRTL